MAIDIDTGEITEDEEVGRRIRPFSEFLTEHRRGELHGEVSEALNELTQAVIGIGKEGLLTITITVRPAGNNHEQVFVADDVRLKLPRPNREEAICFVDDDANLVRRDPRQQELPGIREVAPPKPASAAKEISA